MRRRFSSLMILGLLAATPIPVIAAPSVFSCDTYLESSGEHTRRMMAIDPVHGRVVDGTLDWQDGGPSPSRVRGPLVAFVHQDGQHLEWGTHDTRTGETVSHFSLDLASGAYVFGVSKDTLAHGRCFLLPDGT